VAYDRTPDELGISPGQQAMPATSATAGPHPVRSSGGRPAGAEQPTEAMCRKADWHGETIELPVVALSTPAGPTAEPTADRLRSWGREYGGYVAAGALAVVVLACAMTGLPGTQMTWHAGNSVGAASSPATVRSSPAPAPSATSASSPSATPSRRPTRRPAAAARPRVSRSPARSATPTPRPTPSPAMLGPTGAAALAGIVGDYCDRRFDRSAVLLRPWPGSGAEDNWACQRRRRYDPIMANMTEACVLRYGKAAVARYLDARDPFSWRCYRG
jgi:hypothetical protein